MVLSFKIRQLITAQTLLGIFRHSHSHVAQKVITLRKEHGFSPNYACYIHENPCQSSCLLINEHMLSYNLRQCYKTNSIKFSFIYIIYM